MSEAQVPNQEEEQGLQLPNPHPEMAMRSRRALLWSALSIGGVYGAWRWLIRKGQPMEEELPAFLRRPLELNEALWSRLASNARLSPEFPKSRARKPRPNGRNGLKTPLPGDLEHYAVSLELPSRDPLFTTLDQVRKLPVRDVVTELHCIEGWSEVVHWTGVPLWEFLSHTLGGDDWLAQSEGYLYRYLYAETPDGKYFVSLDMDAVAHPQTLLCFAMNGKPLASEHGAPLRLVVPVKYGIKSLKRVGRIRLTNEEPPDYWRKKGYDGYVGL